MHDRAGVRVQLCGTFAVELDGRSIAADLPGRQVRMLFAYLVLNRPQPIARDLLIDALWGDAPPAASASALTVLISKLRTALGAELIRGRAELAVVLPEPAQVDVDLALAALHRAESAVASRQWDRAWYASLAALFVARRTLLPGADAEWLDGWRRRLADARLRALECYATTCLALEHAELPAAERSARELVELAPLRETGHLLLMRALAAGGNEAEALACYGRLRTVLSDELGTEPGSTVQDYYHELLR
ncbi:BTAD domain-containing putative transcriptional regulator [Occultella aeris]|uniref:Transcriptional regulatory protein EmbR n=1 Tax=Occultella aeris TaxID=2761496 RepID=A0A7M4DMY6_9MICO|nr:BTAD domain-containing putative transcriptional regulator [Occultella aeris]VZO38794.1 Transcriptional regulatory protein EmbR [Occultella aeris]